MSFRSNFDGTGVSPVVGVVLLVAVTVALVALVSIVGFNLQEDVSENSDVSVQFSDGETVRIIRNQNVESIEVRDSSGSVIGSIDSAGEEVDIGSKQDHTVVAIQPDGSEEVIRNIQRNSINVKYTAVLNGSSGNGAFESSVNVGQVTTD